ncbi:MAG: MBL fold metallo-hydrolase, partial [Dehalococcoidales bacterium]|nr:MBL fold metallo-hydrolase [Dehalococcoidales bacterium]
GAGHLARLWPQAKVVLHEQGAKHLIDPTRLIASTKRAFGDNFEETYGPIIPIAEAQVMMVRGGEMLSLGRRKLQVLSAPGHAPNHICIYDNLSRGLFCGEALGLPLDDSEPVMPAAIPPGFDLEASLDTYDQMERLAPSILFYSHDGISREAAKRIVAVRTSTQRVGEMVQAGLKAGEDLKQLCQRVRQGLAEEGSPAAKRDLSEMVAGYMFYFQRRQKASV